MMIFLREDKKEFLKKEIPIPDDLNAKAQQIDATLGKQYPTLDGAKRIKKIANNGEYNKRSADGKNSMSMGEIKRAKHDMSKLNPKSVEYALNGGDEMKQFYDSVLHSTRNAVKENPIVKAVKPNSKDLKPAEQNIKPIEINDLQLQAEGRKTIRLKESQLLLLKK